jgi:anti-sigma B factor antagonist
MSQFAAIHVEKQNGVTVVRFVDEKIMDSRRIQQVDDELNAIIDSAKPGGLLLNMENVRFLSSDALNKLIILDKRMKAAGGAVRLANLRPEIRDLFSITNLDRLFSIYNNTPDALKSFTPGSSSARPEIG